MIHKIVSINGVGKFVNNSPSESNYNWNGIFDRNTAIYADNGSEKKHIDPNIEVFISTKVSANIGLMVIPMQPVKPQFRERETP